MTITPRPDQEQLIAQAIQAGLIHDASEALDIAVDALRNRLTPGPSPAEADRPLAEKIAGIWHDMPAEIRAALPRDGASQIDHYVYGLCKAPSPPAACKS
jgi:uncharacterized protein (DUF2267 family)